MKTTTRRKVNRIPLLRVLQVVFGIFIFGVLWAYLQHDRGANGSELQWGTNGRPRRPGTEEPLKAAPTSQTKDSATRKPETPEPKKPPPQKKFSEEPIRNRKPETEEDIDEEAEKRDKGVGSIFDMKHVIEGLKRTNKVTRGQPPRLLCFVVTTSQMPFELQVNRALKHWGPHTHQGAMCDTLLFSVEEDKKIPADMNASYFWHVGSSTLFRRTYKTWLKLAEEEADNYDWFVKVSPDTLIFPENLRYYLSYYNPSAPYYLGHTLFDFWKSHSVVYNHGAVYTLSRGALKLVRPALEAIPSQKASKSLCIDRGKPEDREDVLMGICLRGVGIVPANTLDNYYAQRFNILSIEVLLSPDSREMHKSMGGKVTQEFPAWFNLLKIEPHSASPSRGDTSYRRCCNLKPLSFGGFVGEREDINRDADLLTFGYNQNSQLFLHDVHIRPAQHFLYQKDLLDFQIDKNFSAVEFCKAHKVAHCTAPLVTPLDKPQNPYLGAKVTTNPKKKPRVMVFAPMAITNAEEIEKNGVGVSSWCPYFDVCKFGVSRSSFEKLPQKEQDSGRYLVLDTKSADGRQARNIWERSWRSWYMMAEEYLDQAEWFVKVDTDSFPLPDNMRNYMSYYDHNNPHYLGHTIMYRWAENIVFNTGSGYMVSREALRQLTPLFREMAQEKQPDRPMCVDRLGPQEDMEFSRCLRLINVLPNDVLDEQGRYYMMTWRPDDHLHMKREDTWFWEYKIKDVGQLQRCCHPKNMGYHNYKDQKDITVLLMRFIYLDNPQLYELDTHVDPTALFQYDASKVDFDLDEFRNNKALCKKPNAAGCLTKLVQLP